MAFFDRKEDYLAVRWAQSVKQRDFFTCQICGCQGEYMESHHLNAWASYPDQRYCLDNGTCLCRTCHEMYHDIQGKGKNTKEEFEEFVEVYRVFLNSIENEVVDDAIIKKISKDIEVSDIVDKIIDDLDGYA